MLIAAVLLELEIAQAESIKAKRRVVKSVIDRVSRRYGVSIAEVAEHDARHHACIGCVKVGVHPQHLREQMEKIVRFVESLGLAEVVGDDVTIARLAELEELEDGEDGERETAALDDELDAEWLASDDELEDPDDALDDEDDELDEDLGEDDELEDAEDEGAGADDTGRTRRGERRR
jgi:hypothetical protein